jgi:hypothetical protein
MARGLKRANSGCDFVAIIVVLMLRGRGATLRLDLHQKPRGTER